MQKPIVFDLTEIMYGAGGKFRYYGILKVVASTAEQFVRENHPVKFCVYNCADNQFYEVIPERLAAAQDKIDLKTPICKQFLVRTVRGRLGRFVQAKIWLQQKIARPLNRRRWSKTGYQHGPISLSGCIFVTAARAKLASEIIAAIRRSGTDTKIAALVHDVIPLYQPDGSAPATTFSTNFLHDTRYLINHADLILGNSKCTIDDLLAFADRGVLPKPQAVVPIPLVHQSDKGAEAPVVDLPKQSYIMVVGASLGRKNLDVVFDAMLQLQTSGQTPPQLVLAGSHRISTQKRIADPTMDPIRDMIVPIHNPNQTDLNRLYQNALAVVLPSHIEGWGLPAGEALWNGTPAIVSDIPAMHEVCGDLGLYFDPHNPQALATYFQALRDNQQWYSMLRERLRRSRGKLRCWSDVTADMLSALENLQPGDNNGISLASTNQPIRVA